MVERLRVGIIGAGHNGLVCACYLQQAGFDVTVYERRDTVGGLCITEELFPGVKASSVAGFFGMLRQEIIDDLQLLERGLEPYFTDPTEIILLPENRYLYTPRLGGEPKIDIGPVDEQELQGWDRFWQEISAAARLIYPYHLKSGVTQRQIEVMLDAEGLSTIAAHIFKRSLLELVSNYFSHPSLLAAVSTCVIGFPDEIGSVYSCIHLGTARTLGAMGAWGLVKGGMGAVTQALFECARERGVKVLTGREVKSVIIENGTATGIEFGDGSGESLDLVISNADPFTTFKKLVPSHMVPDDIRRQIEECRVTASAGKIHFLMNGLPEFPALAHLPNYHASTICLAIPFEAVLDASHDVRAGDMPKELMITILFNTVSDPSLSSNGKHLLSLAYHWLPSVFNGREWDEDNKRALLEQTLAILETHCPTLRQYVEDTVVITPGDLQRVYGAVDCWHLPMTSDFLMEKRSFGDKDYSTPFERLFLCGAGTYPGGNVTGAPGHNCAMQIIESFTNQRVVVREPGIIEAPEVSRMFEAALGAQGIYASGCDQYPDPDLFSPEGISSIIEAPERQLIVAQTDGDIVGGAIIDWSGRHHCEINCVAVAREKRGLGIGTRIFDEAKRIIDRNRFTVNTTEFVTHSLASQSGYMPDGSGNFVGFSYCHYPHVFFADHPESVVWISSLHGQPVQSLSRARQVFVPACYAELAETILAQFSNRLAYTVRSTPSDDYAPVDDGRLKIDWKSGYRYCHLTFDEAFDVVARGADIDEAFEALLAQGKEFVFARIRVNHPSALGIAEHLRGLGFVFHSVLPLYFENAHSTPGEPVFDDVLGMQWIHPNMLSTNPWPGETNSVIKLFGYPQNLTGKIVRAIRQEMEQANRN